MRQLRAWFWRFKGLFRKDARERELADELESHLQMHIDDTGVLALAGIVIGSGCAILAATLMRKLLFGTPPWDITTLVCVPPVLGWLGVTGELPPRAPRRLSRPDFRTARGVAPCRDFVSSPPRAPKQWDY
jgi:hypothetical protein